MEYRLGKMEDIDSICSLIADAIKAMEQKGIYQWDDIYPLKEDFVDDIQKGTLYVATEQDKLLGIYVISTECDEEYQNGKWECAEETACIIHRLCVSPNVQNQGVGNTMLNHMEQQLRERHFKSVRLDVFTENPYAVRLYEKNGYVQRGYVNWRKGRFLLMEKKL